MRTLQIVMTTFAFTYLKHEIKRIYPLFMNPYDYKKSVSVDRKGVPNLQSGMRYKHKKHCLTVSLALLWLHFMKFFDLLSVDKRVGLTL